MLSCIRYKYWSKSIVNVEHGPKNKFKLDFVCIGAARSGTTYLFNCLNKHSNINLAKQKELHFFNNDRLFKEGRSKLESFFEKKEGLKGEITPRYIIDKKALNRIKSWYPNIKVIIILRDPVERTISQWKYFVTIKDKEKETNILKAVKGRYYEDYIFKSQYYHQILNVKEIFENVKIINFVDLINSPEKTFTDLQNYLGISLESIHILDKVNASKSFKTESRPLLNWYKQKILKISLLIDLNIKNKIYPLFNIIHSALVRILNLISRKNKIKLIVTNNEKKQLYETYFKDDIAKLEGLLKINLTDWKH